MNPANVVAWSAQITLVVIACAGLPRLLGGRCWRYVSRCRCCSRGGRTRWSSSQLRAPRPQRQR